MWHSVMDYDGYPPYVSYNDAPTGKRATIYAYRGLLFKTYRIVIEGPEGTTVDSTDFYVAADVGNGYHLEYDVYVGGNTRYGFGGANSVGDNNDYTTSIVTSVSSRIHRSLFVDELVEMPVSRGKPIKHGIFR